MTGVIVLLALLWADFVWAVYGDWIYNDQYSYGWLTLFLVFYLFYLRVSELPARQAPGLKSAGKVVLALIFGLVILGANRVVLESNPEWRSAIWLHVLVIFSMTLAVIWRVGGKLWLRHFAPVFALMLFAVPWPTLLENAVTGGLMRFVSAAVVEGMNILGFYAEQTGSLIRLRNGWVGIEAACSGVRNFQSTLMSAWFVGELFRFTAIGRGLLLVLSGVASLLINIVRTSILTWATHRSGSNLTEALHDPVGHLVSVFAFVFLMLVAFVLRKFFTAEGLGKRSGSAPQRLPVVTEPHSFSRPVLFASVFLLIGGYAFKELWYYRSERTQPQQQALAVDWNNLPVEVEFVDISPAIRGQLRYTEGVQAEWDGPEKGVEWDVFYFSWTRGSVSPFVGIHNPGTCLPASGFEQGQGHPPLVFSLDGKRIKFAVDTYYFMDRPYQVYYATWNDYWGSDIPLVETAKDRLKLAISGNRVTYRRSMQVVIAGIGNEPIARQRVVAFLESALHWEDPR